MHVYNSFCNEQGEFGNPVGVVFDFDGAFEPSDRQKIATALGFSECVFVNDLATRSINIFTPQNEIPFAGHAAVGVAYAIADRYQVGPDTLLSINGPIEVWEDGEITWVKSELQSTPPWWLERLETSREVDLTCP